MGDAPLLGIGMVRPALLVLSCLALAGCASVVSKFVESPVPDGLETHQGEGFVLRTDLTPEEVAVVATYLQEARAECDRLFGIAIGGDFDVYIFRHGEETSGRWRYAVSLPTGAIHIGYHYALRRGGPPLRLEDLQNGILGDTLRHEISHQHLYRVLGRLPRHPWLYEGLPMLIESVQLDRSDGTLLLRPSRSVYLEVARQIEDGLCLLPEHVLDMGWQDFYEYAEYGTYGIAASLVDLLHDEAGRPADLKAFCRDLVRRRNAGLIPDPGLRERWRKHVLAGAELQVQHLKRDIREGNPYERLAALEVLSFSVADPRWGDGERILRRALVEQMTRGDDAVKARSFSLALDVLAQDEEDPEEPADDLRLPVANWLRVTQEKADHDLVLHWLQRLETGPTRFWNRETVATLGWTLESPDPGIRAAGLRRIGQYGGPAFLGPIADLIASAESAEYVPLAMVALAGIARERAMAVLEPCLDGGSERLRDGAAIALAEWRHPRARERVLAMASRSGHPHEEWAYQALSRYPDPATREFLTRRAREDGAPILSAMRALLGMGTPEAFAALAGLVAEPDLRAAALLVMLEDLDRTDCRDFLAQHLSLLGRPSLALIWSLSDEQLRPHVAALVGHAEAMLADLELLESFMVRRRLARMGVAVEDGEARFERLARIGELGWPHEQQILAQLAAEVDPERTLDVLIAQLGGSIAAREGAIRCLRALTEHSHDFHWAAPKPYRDEALATWRAWRKETSGRLSWEDGTGRIRVK